MKLRTVLTTVLRKNALRQGNNSKQKSQSFCTSTVLVVFALMTSVPLVATIAQATLTSTSFKLKAEQFVAEAPLPQEQIPSSGPVQKQEKVASDTSDNYDSTVSEEAQRELSASEAAIQQLVNEDLIEGSLNKNQPFPSGDVTSNLIASVEPSSAGTLTQRERALQMAETQIGYTDKPRGSNCNKFSSYFGKGCQPWCADFVSWAFDWQGNRDRKIRWGNPSAVASILAWGRANNHMVTSPRRGDIFIIKNSTASHTGFVRAVDLRAGTFTTVEGNTGTDNVKSSIRTISKYQFVRFP